MSRSPLQCLLDSDRLNSICVRSAVSYGLGQRRVADVAGVPVHHMHSFSCPRIKLATCPGETSASPQLLLNSPVFQLLTLPTQTGTDLGMGRADQADQAQNSPWAANARHGFSSAHDLAGYQPQVGVYRRHIPLRGGSFPMEINR